MTVEVELYARNMELAENLKDYVTKKASKLDRYLNEVEHVRVDLTYNKSARSADDRNVAQITVRGRGALLRVEETSADITAAIDKAIDKMQRQLDRYKGKHSRGRGDGRSASEVAPVPTPVETDKEEVQVIARHKTFDLIPMNEAEALEQMKLLGHDNFFIFFNVDSNSINVLYHRRDGTYGLIEPKIG
jgi:putative sigma-54 modulation protein